MPETKGQHLEPYVPTVVIHRQSHLRFLTILFAAIELSFDRRFVFPALEGSLQVVDKTLKRRILRRHDVEFDLLTCFALSVILHELKCFGI